MNFDLVCNRGILRRLTNTLPVIQSIWNLVHRLISGDNAFYQIFGPLPQIIRNYLEKLCFCRIVFSVWAYWYYWYITILIIIWLQHHGLLFPNVFFPSKFLSIFQSLFFFNSPFKIYISLTVDIFGMNLTIYWTSSRELRY